MQQTKEIVKTGKQMGKKVLATDTAQDVVGVVVDGLEEVTVDKADDVAENLKKRAARLGLEVPWEEDTDRENRTVWLDRDGIAARMLEAIGEEVGRRGLR